MFITLYKNCIFSSNYNEVCYCKTYKNKNPRDEYLNLLPKIRFEIEDTFTEINGTLNFDYTSTDYSGNIYDFNYLKIENSINDFVGFYFIKNITIRNDIVLLDYEIDVWNTFSSKMQLRNSYLSQCKEINSYKTTSGVNFKFHKLPVEYYSNDNITYEAIFPGDIRFRDKYRIILVYQLYTATLAGETGQRASRTGYYYNNELHRGYFNYNETIDIINRLLIARSQTQSGHGIVSNEQDLDLFLATIYCYFEISHIYIVPAIYDIDVYSNSIQCKIAEKTLTGEYTDYDVHYIVDINELRNSYTTLKEIDVLPDFKNLRIGTFTENFEIENNGTPIHCKLGFSWNETNCSFILNVDKEIYDITKSFEYEIQFESISGAENVQRRIAMAIGVIGGIAKTTTAGVKLTTMGKTGLSWTGETITSRQGKEDINISRKNKHIAKTSSSTQVSRKSSYSYMDFFDAGNDAVNGTMDIIGSAIPYYTSNNQIIVENNCFLNANYGDMIVFKMSAVDNLAFVNKMIEETGYNVCYIGGNEILDGLFDDNQSIIDYNVIKFDFVKLYGAFPQIIGDKLRDILLNGVKIYYDETNI